MTSEFLVLKQTHAPTKEGRRQLCPHSFPPLTDSVTNAAQARLKKDLHKYTVLLNTQSNSRPLT